MILHDEKNYTEYDVESPKAMSAYFRYCLHERNKKDVDKEKYLKEMYESLPSAKKRLINVLVQDLLSKSKRWKIFKVYLDRFIKTDCVLNNLKIENVGKLEKYIYSYMVASKKYADRVIDNKKVHSAMQRLEKDNAPQEKNVYVSILADFFNISKEVLLTGQGNRYYLNYDYIQLILDNKKEDYNEFVNKVCNHGQLANGITNTERKNYAFYVNHSYRVFAELASELLCVNIDNILIAEPCWVELKDYPFIEFYKELSYDNQNIVQHVLFNLNLK